jgi:hypothetical protein
MEITCICTEEVASIVLIPSTGEMVFTTITTIVLDDGTAVGSQSEAKAVDLPDTLLAEVMALNVTK